MKNLTLIVSFLLLLVPGAMADGPPVERDGTITTDHLAIKLNLNQIKQIEETHIIDLTTSQHELIKRFYKKLPKRFVVVTPHFNDCTCDLIYLIWNKNDTVAFPIYEARYIKELLEDRKHPYDYRGLINNWNKGKIIIDTLGNMNYEGKRLDRNGLEAVLKRLSTNKDKFARWIPLSVPPYLNTDYANKIESVIREIEGIAEKYEIKIQIGG